MSNVHTLCTVVQYNKHFSEGGGGGGGLVYMRTCLQGEAHLRRRRLVYMEGDSSTEGGDLSVEGETRLRMGRLVYGGSYSCT
jgi:hypothetical protein